MDESSDTYFQRRTAAPTDLYDLITSDNNTAPSGVTSTHRHSVHQPMSSAGPRTTSRQARARSLSFAGLSRQPQVQAAQKTGDDPTASTTSRFAAERRQRISTPDRLTRLLAGPSSPPLSASSSRQTSYRDGKDSRAAARPSQRDAMSLNGHLFTRGLLGGRHSDIVVRVFGRAYPLHKIILDRSPFFSSALTEPWLEASAKEIALHPEDTDANITPVSFELALKRLYGCHSVAEEEAHARSLFAAARWLEMQDLIDAATTAILRQMHPQSLSQTIQLVTKNYYGKPGEKILASAKTMLCRDGWSMPISYWDEIPSDVLRELVGGDSFFVHGEWDRWVLARSLLDRRLKALAQEAGLYTPSCTQAPKQLQKAAQRPRDSVEKFFDDAATISSGDAPTVSEWQALYAHADIVPLLGLLDHGIYYMHLGFEYLQIVRSARDVLGVPLVPDGVVSNALWRGLELRQKILTADEADEELGLARSQSVTDENHKESSESPGSDIERPEPRRFWIPRVDRNIVVGASSDSTVTTSGNTRHRSSLAAKNDVHHADAVQWFSDFVRERSQTGSSPPSSSSSADAIPAKYSSFPPFRFAVDFPNPRTLKEKRRVYSQTVFYAGSYWNLYIQKMRADTGGTQLGVYLYRTRDREVESNDTFIFGVSKSASHRSTVDNRIGALEREMQMRSERRSRRQSQRRSSISDSYTGPIHGGNADEADTRTIGIPTITTFPSSSAARSAGPRARVLSTLSASNQARSGASEDSDINFISSPGCDSPISSSSSPPSPLQGPAGTVHASRMAASFAAAAASCDIATLPPYADARPTIRTYFRIYSPSKGGRMLSVYESEPDRFSFNKSWGWMGSTLTLDDGGLASSAPYRPGAGVHGHNASSNLQGYGSGRAFGDTLADPNDDVEELGEDAHDTGPMFLSSQHKPGDGHNDAAEDSTGSFAARAAHDGTLRFMVVLGVV